MTDPDHPSSRRLGRAGAWVAALLLAMMLVFFVGRNLWHRDILKEDQQTGENRATSYEETPELKN